MQDSPPRKKVAVLGGGVGAMVTAFELTQPEVRERYDVTVYQLGWRLGGKGASGRNAEACQRIEEHGIHVWAGLYDNAFRVIRAAYAEMGRTPGTPLATWRDAFKPMVGTALMERHGDDWVVWPNVPPTNDQLPGEEDAHLLLPFWSYVGEGLQLVRRWFRSAQRAKHAHNRKNAGVLGRVLTWLVHALVLGAIELAGAAVWLLYGAARLVHRVLAWVVPRPVLGLLHGAAHAAGGLIIAVVRLLLRLHWLRVRDHLDDLDVRKGWIFLNLSLGVLRGIHRDDVVRKGVDVVDHLDFREWLSGHILPDAVTLDSPLAKFLYDADFAFAKGDHANPQLSAAVALYSMFRLAVTWKGACIWEMQAGMGDTVFTPFYQVLKRRGVKFEFFRKVKGLHLTEDGSAIGSITVARQAALRKGLEAYDPLVEVKGLDCWPSQPHWDQLEDGEAYRTAGVDFEDWCSPEVEDIPLVLGRDFDEVVLGISLGGIPYICGELIDARPEWRAMVDNVATVRTLAAQLWLDRSDAGLGWEHEKCTDLSTYEATPFDSWASMSHLIEREVWPDAHGGYPESIAYFAGPMAEADPPRGRPQTCEELEGGPPLEEVRAITERFLNTAVFRIFGDVATDGSFEWERLVDCLDPEAQGPERLASQYIRANVQPTERYVQSIPGTSRYRLHPGDSKFENLVLAGDWTWTAFNAGCVEGATISGMLAAHALCGSPPLERIVGLTFGRPDSRYQPRGGGR